MEGTQEVRREDVWRHMPRVEDPKLWGELIDDAIQGRAEAIAYGQHLDDARHEWADGWVPVYNGPRADKFHELDLWACAEVMDRLNELGTVGVDADGVFSFSDAFGSALYVAAELTWDAVAAAVEASAA